MRKTSGNPCPVVSLRSTTGYWLGCLRHRKEDDFPASHQDRCSSAFAYRLWRDKQSAAPYDSPARPSRIKAWAEAKKEMAESAETTEFFSPPGEGRRELSKGCFPCGGRHSEFSEWHLPCDKRPSEFSEWCFPSAWLLVAVDAWAGRNPPCGPSTVDLSGRCFFPP